MSQNGTTTTTNQAVHIKTTTTTTLPSNTTTTPSSDNTSSGDPSPVPSNYSASLTYVSSVMESTSAGMAANDPNVYCDYDGIAMTKKSKIRESGSTSLFEDDDYDERQSMASTYTTESAVTGPGRSRGPPGDAYSISGSSYTADMMNQDDFEDEDDIDELDDDDERLEEDEYDNIDDETTNSQMTQPGVS